MTASELRYLWYTDLYRYRGRTDVRTHLKSMIKDPGYCYSYHLRLATYLRTFRSHWWGKLLSRLHWLVLSHYSYKFGISISPKTPLGPGLYIGHFGAIVVGKDCSIGANFSLAQEVTLGVKNRGEYAGSPTLGDNVYVAPGAKIIGGITVGDNVAVGANAVVTHDVPSGATVAGVPARVISEAGAEGYVTFTDYLDYGAWLASRRETR